MKAWNSTQTLTFTFVLGAVAIACAGAKETEFFGAPADAGSSGTSGTSGIPTPDASSGGSTTSSSSTSSTSTSSTSGAPDGGRPCNAAAPQQCNLNEYCKVTGCGTAGTCTTKPTISGTLGAVCGCDGVTYWNETVAASFGASVSKAGPCAPQQAVACTNQKKCDGGRFCNMQTTLVGCQNPVGTCWGLPPSCPQPPTALRACGANGPNGCRSLCQAIKDQKTYYEDAVACP